MRRLEQYAMIGDRETAALVASDGAIDWMCAPAFDSRACFAALLGRQEHGTFRLRPLSRIHTVRRRYVEGTLVLETEMSCDDGAIMIVDFMPLGGRTPQIVRIVEGRRGRVRVGMELVPRFDYGSLLPYVRVDGHSMIAIGGPDGLSLIAPAPLRKDVDRVRTEISIGEGESAAFVLEYFPSHLSVAAPLDPFRAREECIAEWRSWSSRCTTAGKYARRVLSSLVTLKALTYAPTGAVVGAPTISMHEGHRHWEYRYCWLRDATFTLYALLQAGYRHEAIAWRDWLLRAVSGQAQQIQTLYGLFGERRLAEQELRWLPQGMKPATEQLRIDMFGELMDAFDLCRRAGIPPEDESWGLQHDLACFLESAWRRPDKGIWETRGPARHFVHSKVMAWVALDRAIRAVERSGLPGPVDRWRSLRVQIHEEVCRRGWDDEMQSFVQYYGAKWPDASLLLIPLVGFLPPNDPRVASTVALIERELCEDGLVSRYPTMPSVDGLANAEGKFLACSFWLADARLLLGRRSDAIALFERLLDLTNDVGLLSEEYDLERRCLVGNFPQALSHIALANTARNLEEARGPARDRSEPHVSRELRRTG